MPRFISFFALVVGIFLPTEGIPAPTVPMWAQSGALVFVDEARESGRLSLVIPTPDAIPDTSLLKSLPHNGEKLLRGGVFTILAIGDSVTATGPYPEILTRLLERITGNHKIKVIRAAYPGRSVDAAVRRFDSDIAPAKADLALVMFGLNDQAAGSSIEAFVEQTRWLVERLSAQGSDVVLLEPTPHINITPLAGEKAPPAPESSIFRTLNFAASVRELGTQLGIPVAPTFDALWGEGGTNLQQTAINAWRLFPEHYSKPFTSLVDTQGRGDTIHPNAQGHLKMATAVFATLAGRISSEPLAISAVTQAGTDGRLVSRLAVRNDSSEERQGRLAVYPFVQDDTHQLLNYSLKKGASVELVFVWPEVVRIGGRPALQIIDFHDNGSRALAVQAPLSPDARWLHERLVAKDPKATARLRVGAATRDVAVSWPADSEVGRLPLAETVPIDGGEIRLRAELAYVRYAAAPSDEATVDGDLLEWADARWVPVGEPVQARWVKGPEDHRVKPEECYLQWAFKAGREGIWLAFRANGEVAKDRFSLYFDTRLSAELGTAGPYTWVDGGFKSDGTMTLKAGDSTPAGATAPKGRWRSIGDSRLDGEIFIPYAVLNTTNWPEDGDLGFSIVWAHSHADGRVTRLMWAEDGHPWNTRWFGVVRRDPVGPLPWRVRVQ